MGLLEHDVAALLRAQRLRRTPCRERVLALLLRVRRPLSHDQILRRLGRRTDRVTVYRTLDALVRVGLVHRVFADRRNRLFETADRCSSRACHPHFTCRECGRTVCLTGVRVPRVRRTRAGFVFERQRILIEGLCPACAH